MATFKQFLTESNADKSKFRELVASGFLCHATSRASAKKIVKMGLKKTSYFGFNGEGWEGDVTFFLAGSVIANTIYPDPEHMMEHPVIHELWKSGKIKQISFNTVTKHIHPDELFTIFFENNADYYEHGDVDQIHESTWLVSAEAISPEKFKTAVVKQLLLDFKKSYGRIEDNLEVLKGAGANWPELEKIIKSLK